MRLDSAEFDSQTDGAFGAVKFENRSALRRQIRQASASARALRSSSVFRNRAMPLAFRSSVPRHPIAAAG